MKVQHGNDIFNLELVLKYEKDPDELKLALAAAMNEIKNLKQCPECGEMPQHKMDCSRGRV